MKLKQVGSVGGRSLRGLDREHGGPGGPGGRGGGKMSSKPHIKKPLNAFMLYMKEMRPKIVAECTLKESAAINQILGRRVRKEKKRNRNLKVIKN
jgi:hypothetical protein